MIRALAILFLLGLPGHAFAQDMPVLRQELDTAEVVPGQTLSLRLSVLVPSYMPKPPVWPGFETPDVMVRLPERATGPISERIARATWSGVTRRIEITPLQPGSYTLPAARVEVTWADPDTGALRTASLATEPVHVIAQVPDASRALDPFVAAGSLKLSRQVEGDPAHMQAGDSVRITMTATISGAPALVIPPLPAIPAIPGIALYPDPPKLAETADGGSRTESVTLVAEGKAKGTIPAMTLGWYDLGGHAVRQARLDPLEVSAAPPPLDLHSAAGLARLARLVLPPLAGLVLLLLAARLLWPVWRRARRRYQGSEHRAWRQLRAVLRRRDFPALHPAIELWHARRGGADPRDRPGVAGALLAIGRSRYNAKGPDRDAWALLSVALAAERRAPRGPAATALPPLNPGPTGS